jgi:hypothetical protein
MKRGILERQSNWASRAAVHQNDTGSSWPQCCFMDSECPVSTVSCFFKEFALLAIFHVQEYA